MSYVPPINREIQDFYRNHVDSVYRSCCFLTGGQGNAQAMTRDVFLKLLSQGLEFSSDKDARAWMILTAYRLAKKKEYYMPETVHQEADSMPEETTQSDEAVLKEVAPEPEAAPVQSPDTEEAAAEEEIQPEQGDEAVEEQPEECAEQSEQLPAEESEPDEKTEAEVEMPAETLPEEPVQVQIMDVYAEIRKLSRKDRLVALLYYCEGYRKTEIANYLGCLDMAVKSRLRRVKKMVQDDVGGDE